ncbi:hypothetical protein Acor_16170 [Acrocarpospora corrugata]|uniref:Uncharacterized protein n=1 Tax=Acrocarpospora corrugata TaxID=35763 RepID=A0A5M3VSQ3_9ACTN|nr:hypothetical protein [Acrocarpospora corrugata]GER99553.1 hypothetical protein Acor_16170 [Acrocarpospora corrugata]
MAAGLTVVVAAVNVTTGTLTQHRAWAWWADTIVLVAPGAATQMWLTLAEREAGDERDGGARVSGNVSGIISTGEGSTNTRINPPGA